MHKRKTHNYFMKQSSMSSIQKYWFTKKTWTDLNTNRMKTWIVHYVCLLEMLTFHSNMPASISSMKLHDRIQVCGRIICNEWPALYLSSLQWERLVQACQKMSLLSVAPFRGTYRELYNAFKGALRLAYLPIFRPLLLACWMNSYHELWNSCSHCSWKPPQKNYPLC